MLGARDSNNRMLEAAVDEMERIVAMHRGYFR
jgi:hypothetical protein